MPLHVPRNTSLLTARRVRAHHTQADDLRKKSERALLLAEGVLQSKAQMIIELSSKIDAQKLDLRTAVERERTRASISIESLKGALRNEVIQRVQEMQVPCPILFWRPCVQGAQPVVLTLVGLHN